MGAQKPQQTVGFGQMETEEMKRARLAESVRSPAQKTKGLANAIAGLQGSNPSLLTVEAPTVKNRSNSLIG